MARPDPRRSALPPDPDAGDGFRHRRPIAQQRPSGIGDAMRSRSLVTSAADLESLRTCWADLTPDLVFCFCAPDLDLGRHAAARVSAAFPRATVIGCSTAGEIGVDGACDGLV